MCLGVVYIEKSYTVLLIVYIILQYGTVLHPTSGCQAVSRASLEFICIESIAKWSEKNKNTHMLEINQFSSKLY